MLDSRPLRRHGALAGMLTPMILDGILDDLSSTPAPRRSYQYLAMIHVPTDSPRIRDRSLRYESSSRSHWSFDFLISRGEIELPLIKLGSPKTSIISEMTSSKGRLAFFGTFGNYPPRAHGSLAGQVMIVIFHGILDYLSLISIS